MGQLTMGNILAFVKELKKQWYVTKRDTRVAYLSWRRR